MPVPFGSFPPRRVPDLLSCLETFISVANANLAETGLTAGQVTALNDKHLALSNAWGTLVAARTASLGATDVKDAALADALGDLRELARIVQSHPGASNQLKHDLGLPVHDNQPAPVIPSDPSTLAAVVGENGRIFLTWDRNGNKSGTNFIVQFREGASGPWQFVASTTKSRYVDEGRTPGVYLQYRVYAVRAERQSLPCPWVQVYGPDGDTVQLSVAA